AAFKNSGYSYADMPTITVAVQEAQGETGEGNSTLSAEAQAFVDAVGALSGKGAEDVLAALALYDGLSDADAAEPEVDEAYTEAITLYTQLTSTGLNGDNDLPATRQNSAGYGILTTGTGASSVVDDNGAQPLATNTDLSFSLTSGSTYVLNVVAKFPEGVTGKSVKVTLPFGLVWSDSGANNANVTNLLSAAGVVSGDAFTGYGLNTAMSRTYNFIDSTDTVTIPITLVRNQYVTDQTLPTKITAAASWNDGTAQTDTVESGDVTLTGINIAAAFYVNRSDDSYGSFITGNTQFYFAVIPANKLQGNTTGASYRAYTDDYSCDITVTYPSAPKDDNGDLLSWLSAGT
ncbi:MAG: hypothetical protein Q4B48_08580, partial [Syntrophomonadaceae bacterium]|nr:hypothetical protein [Syntrophomonadaceae bacterium]